MFLPLALASQLSTSGISKAIPEVLCKFIWSFVMEHNTAKIIKAALFAYQHTPELRCYRLPPGHPKTQFVILHIVRLTKIIQKCIDDMIYLDVTNITRMIACKSFVLSMYQVMQNGERHAPPRPSGKSLANPICIQ